MQRFESWHWALNAITRLQARLCSIEFKSCLFRWSGKPLYQWQICFTRYSITIRLLVMVGEFHLNFQFWTDLAFCSLWSDRENLTNGWAKLIVLVLILMTQDLCVPKTDKISRPPLSKFLVSAPALYPRRLLTNYEGRCWKLERPPRLVAMDGDQGFKDIGRRGHRGLEEPWLWGGS